VNVLTCSILHKFLKTMSKDSQYTKVNSCLGLIWRLQVNVLACSILHRFLKTMSKYSQYTKVNSCLALDLDFRL
jgi:hypothetical protein